MAFTVINDIMHDPGIKIVVEKCEIRVYIPLTQFLSLLIKLTFIQSKLCYGEHPVRLICVVTQHIFVKFTESFSGVSGFLTGVILWSLC